MTTLTATKSPALTPILSDWMQELFQHKALLQQMIARYGSPSNVLHLPPFAHNYQKYRQVLDRHQLRGQVFFARKANKYRHLVQAAHQLGFGVDTASYRELHQCLELGLPANRLVLTAAIKNERLLRLAAENDVLVIIDNEDEYNLLRQIAKAMNKSLRVGLRVSGFQVDDEKLYSRFGVDIDDAEAFMLKYLRPGQNDQLLHFTGFHFHLNGYSPRERSVALHRLMDLGEQMARHGFTTHFIDMGGGLLMNYLHDADQWQAFHGALREAALGQRPPLTFGNNGLGVQLHDRQLIGTPQVYPYYNELPQDRFLEKVLTFENESGQTVAQRLRAADIELRMEPGRSLLDQCGMTIAKVVFRKYDSRGDLLVGLDMNRTQMFSSSADFLLDPVVVHQKEASEHDREVGAYFVGAFCLEQDVILKRKIQLAKVPDVGDLVCFPNTAGYMMHFYETEAHLFELATNLVLEKDEEGHFTFKEDEELQ